MADLQPEDVARQIDDRRSQDRALRLPDIAGAVLRAFGDDHPAGRPLVIILTFCRRMDLLYGSTLVFKTLRTGFPTATVLVVDNASLTEARPIIRSQAEETGCRFLQIEQTGVQHHDFLNEALRGMGGENAPRGPLIFLDPDVCLWSSCEGFTFDALMAGRLVRPFALESRKTLTLPRLHTSFMWIPAAQALWRTIRAIQAEYFDFDPFRCFTARVAGQWCRFDTGASLYAAIADRTACFGDEHHACYDHLFCGCHLDWLLPWVDERMREGLRRIHENARTGNLEAIRGSWPMFDEVFGGRTHGGRVAREGGTSCVKTAVSVP